LVWTMVDGRRGAWRPRNRNSRLLRVRTDRERKDDRGGQQRFHRSLLVGIRGLSPARQSGDSRSISPLSCTRPLIRSTGFDGHEWFVCHAMWFILNIMEAGERMHAFICSLCVVTAAAIASAQEPGSTKADKQASRTLTLTGCVEK